MTYKTIALFFICTLSTSFYAKPSTAESAFVKEWTEDINYLHRQLELRHIDLYHQISKPEFESALNAIKLQLPELNQSQVALELMRLFRKIGDGHTQFAYWGSRHHRFPLELTVFDEKLQVTAIPPKHKQLLGAELVFINGIAIGDIVQRLRPLLQGVENSYSEMQRLAETITVAEMLIGIGIATQDKAVEFGFKDIHGNRFNITLASNKPGPVELARPGSQAPASFIKHNASIKGVELLLDTKMHTALIRFDSYPESGMSEFAEQLSGIFSQHNIRNLIIDLRENGGGDFFVGLTLAWGLVLCDQLDWRNGIYTLTGRRTFSAAMSNAVQFRQILNAKLIGEPTGANPVGYQDAGTFELPHSGWRVMYSKRFYRFQETASLGVQPDVYIKPNLGLLMQGKDAQLEWILADIRKRN